jgi:HlyD family secretion protein
MKKRAIIYLLIGAVVLAGIFFIINSGRSRRLVEVKTTTVSTGDVKAYLSTTATVKSQNSKEYYGLQAKVKGVNVKIGDRVSKGETLITYETQDLATAVKQAQLQYDNAILQRRDLVNQNNSIKSKISDLNNQISSLQGSNNPQDISKLEALKQQRNALQPISDEKLKQSDNAVALAKLSLDSTKQKSAENKGSITAENDGVVTLVEATIGVITNGMQPVVIVQDTENLEAVAALGKYDANKIKLGQEVIIKSGSNQYKGAVSFINPAATKTLSAVGGETTLGIKIDIIDKAPDLRIDFDVDVDILLGHAENVIKVPAECIRPGKGDKNYLYVVENGVVREREVLIGLQSDMEVQIKNGVSAGEKVILNPSASIREGVIVKEAVEGSK